MSKCKLCHSLVKTAGLARLAIDFEPWELLQSEELSGCRACATILAGIRRLQNPSWHFEDDVRRVYLYGSSTNHDTLSAEIYYKDDRPRLVLEFYHLSDDGDAHRPWGAIRVRKQTNGHPLEWDALSWVKLNLDICEHDHESCSPNINPPLPLRTLHLRKSAEDTVNVTLVEGEPGVTTGRYATLSHRWGNHKSCITTQSNIQDRKCSILWDTIPKTFQDAMIYCLKLGIEYLWIDALCIIQDNPKDWQQQSAQMAGIYRNSYMTLSATTTINDSVGCFGVRPTTPEQCNESLLSQSPPIYVREKLRHWTDPAGGSLKENFPLLTRGWVFQERILSMRTLHFCDQELVWECAGTTICECASISVDASIKQQFATSAAYSKLEMPIKQADFSGNEETVSDLECDQTDPKIVDYRDTSLTRMLGWIKQSCVSFMGNANKELPEAEKEESQAHHDAMKDKRENFQRQLELAKVESKKRLSLRIRGDGPFLRQETNGRDLEIWHKMVEQYSKLELTSMSDRLPALSGLAERVAPESRPYLAGLWNDTIRLDLLWRVDQISEAHRRTPGNLGPTWSWSSVSSGVKYWTREELKENVFYTWLDTQDQRHFGTVGRTSIREYRERQRLLRRQQREHQRFGRQQLGQRMLRLGGESDGYASRQLANRAELDQISPELLDWCLLERSCTSIPSISHAVVQIGENPFGEVKHGILKIEGYMRKATLKYVKLPTDKRGHGWENDPLQYQLDLSTGGRQPAFEDVQIHFFADYNLSESYAEHKVPHNHVVYLLEVLVNIFLVLKPLSVSDGRRQFVMYHRIGIFRAPMTLDQSFGTDLMTSGEIVELWLI